MPRVDQRCLIVVFQDWQRHSRHCDGSALQRCEDVPSLLHLAPETTRDEVRDSVVDDATDHLPTPPLEDTVSMVVGFLAHPVLEYPQLVQIRLVRDNINPLSPYPVPALGAFFSGSYGRILLQFGTHMEFRSKPLHIFYCVDSYINDQFPNRAIQRLTRGAFPPPKPWPGIVVVLKTSCVTLADYINVESSDVADIREFFIYVQ
ncbi:hypothetical protein C8Q76DRAFT_790213 [Earliella scabrosa]|nr:hypothetical protein C8Q76DRAFT_790213 [Earliella scabrosa]